MAPSRNAFDRRLPPLPIGRLSAATLHVIGIGRLVHFRTGPWVMLAEEGSRVVCIHDGSEPPLFVEAPQAPALFRRAESAADHGELPATPARSRAVVLATPPRRGSGARRHRERTRRRVRHG